MNDTQIVWQVETRLIRLYVEGRDIRRLKKKIEPISIYRVK
jgi:hypothetical protein